MKKKRIENKVEARLRNKNIEKKAKEAKPKKAWHLIVKFLLLVVIAVSAVVWTDKKGYFLSENNETPHRWWRWESFYNITSQDTIDIIILGTSHAYTGVNPKNLSCALGCNCFVMASNAASIMDSYYCLQEMLTKTTPKLVIIDTYSMRNRTLHHLTDSDLSQLFRSFYIRRNIGLKLKSTPKLFSIEEMFPAWSTTIRNHEMILRAPEEIKNNMSEEVKKTYKVSNQHKLYLGRHSNIDRALSDSILNMYKAKGSPVNGEEEKISIQEMQYAQKIVSLCKEKNIVPLFVTIPMYYKHIKNYDAWHICMSKAINPTGAKWLDLQQHYDTTLYKQDCFEDTYDANQHSTYTGSLIFTYQLANYILDSLKIKLPNRTTTDHWHNMFYGEEGYFENFSPSVNDTVHRLIAKDTMINGVHLIDFVVNMKDTTVSVKIDKLSDVPNSIDLYVEAIIDGKNALARMPMTKSLVYDCPRHRYYNAKLIKMLDIIRIKELKYNK